ncbi:MAG: acyl-CoA thioesterase [Cytophagales bacterium]|nr:MAG: acyl-CoA thioesterase [Cytophagales bacterium]
MPKVNPAEIRSAFTFSKPIQVRFSDIDRYLHVNNGIYFSYFEHARAVFLYEACGWNVLTVGTVVGRVEIDYLRPIHMEDQVEALVRCTRVGNSSFDLDQYLVGKNAASEELVFAKCKCILVSVDMKTMKPVPVPAEYRAKLEQS